MNNLNENIIAFNNCKNKPSFGGNCYAFCPYRENGCCELSKSMLIKQLLSSMLGEEILCDVYEDGFIPELIELYKKKNQNLCTTTKLTIGDKVKSSLTGRIAIIDCGNETSWSGHYLDNKQPCDNNSFIDEKWELVVE